MLAEGTLYLTNYRILFQGCLSRTSSLDRNGSRVIVRSVPVAGIGRVNWMALEEQWHEHVPLLLRDALAVRSKTFQLLILTQRHTRELVLETLHSSISRMVFSSSINDTFAFYTSTRARTQLTPGNHDETAHAAHAVHRALVHQASIRLTNSNNEAVHSAATAAAAAAAASTPSPATPGSGAEVNNGFMRGEEKERKKINCIVSFFLLFLFFSFFWRVCVMGG